MRKKPRYWIEIKDAKGSILLAAAAVWDGHDRRAAVAKILRLDGVLEAPSFPSQRSGEEVAANIDVERMAASFAITAPGKKKPRH
jgi:methylmalonyl-CoA mutase cobalamin-binding subunit